LLPKALVATVTDQFGNPISGAVVSFSDGGAGGSFSANSITTKSTGAASVNYTTPGTPGSVTVTASVSGVSAAANFSVTVQ
jgi:hypothetical protein